MSCSTSPSSAPSRGSGPDRRLEDQYNTERPHSPLGYLTPVQFGRAWTEQPNPSQHSHKGGSETGGNQVQAWIEHLQTRARILITLIESVYQIPAIAILLRKTRWALACGNGCACGRPVIGTKRPPGTHR